MPAAQPEQHDHTHRIESAAAIAAADLALADARQAFDAHSNDDKKRFAVEMEHRAGDMGRIVIWVIVLIIMAGVIFFFGYLGYLRVAADKDGAVLFTFATTALGAIAGLLAPSPMSK